jgi:hypothetical protein
LQELESRKQFYSIGQSAMFTIPRTNVVSSDEGFSVEVLGRIGIEYREGGKSMFADSEVLAVGHGIMAWNHGDQGLDQSLVAAE